MPDPLLSVAGLTIERGGRVVFADLAFSVAAGDALHVLGRNGAGKSTLLRGLAGLLPIHAGTIHVAGASEEVRAVETIHYLGYEDALKPALSVRENLEFWAAMLRDSTGPRAEGPRAERPRAEGPRAEGPRAERESPARSPREALAAFGIARLLDLPAGYLSAGQKRRVALARLLLARRPIWLLDEPLIALDLGAQATLAAIMAAHVAGGGAIIAASHAPLGMACRTLDLGGAA